MFYDVQRIVGLGDGEYLETEELVERDDETCEFGPGELEKAAAYCRKSNWSSENGFEGAWKALETLTRGA